MTTVVAKKTAYQGKLPDFLVSAQDPHKENRYFPIGAAWKAVTKDGVEYISVRLTSIPLDGKLRLFVPRGDEPASNEEVPF